MAQRNNHNGTSPVYQIDFTALAAGKRIASTKRRVRWRFGFTNQEALQAGETGTACRGEEHDVTLVWSITSGKRLILADGQEVHYSVSRSGNFDATWTMRGNHVLKVVAYASPPINAGPGFRQYDFFVDGQSFFFMPKVYRLGLTTGGRPGASSRPHAYSQRPPSDANIAAIEMPHNTEEEEAYLQEAIKQSLEDNTKQEEAPPALPPSEPPKKEENLLLDFFDSPAPAPAALPALPAPAASTLQENGIGSSNPQPTLSDVSSDYGFAAPAPAPNAGYAQPSPAAPAPALPYAQPPASALGFASPPQPAPAPAYSFASQPSPFDQAAQQQPQAQFAAPPAPSAGGSSAALGSSFSLSMNPPAPAPATNADQAYQNLANLNDFNLSSKTDASNPFGSTVSAPQPTLGDLKTIGGGGGQAPKQEVMKSSPPALGALVVSGNQSGNWSGYAQTGGQQVNQASGQGLGQNQPLPPGSQYGGYGAAPNQNPGYGAYGAQPPPQQQYGQQQQPQYYGQQQHNYGAPQHQYQYQQQF